MPNHVIFKIIFDLFCFFVLLFSLPLRFFQNSRILLLDWPVSSFDFHPEGKVMATLDINGKFFLSDVDLNKNIFGMRVGGSGKSTS